MCFFVMVGDPLTGMLDALSNEFSVQRMGGVGGGMLRDLLAVSANLPVSIPSYKLMIYALFSLSSTHFQFLLNCSFSNVIKILQTLSRLFPKDTLLWKLEMLKSAIASVNSHIYSVRAETLILLRSNKFLCFIDH